MAQTEKHKLFAACQEGARKDMERAFGVLARGSILRRPARYDRGNIHNIMMALHHSAQHDSR
jgi:hypothetical protein